MNVKVNVDQKLCIGSGSCVVIASEHFALNKKGKAEGTQFEGKKIKENELKKLLEAARACPTQAISIVDEAGKKIY